MKRKPPSQNTVAGQPTATVINRPPVNVNKQSSDNFGNKPRKPKGGKKLTKADIGLPTDFRSVVAFIEYVALSLSMAASIGI